MTIHVNAGRTQGDPREPPRLTRLLELAAMLASAEDAHEYERVTPIGKDTSLSFVAPATGHLGWA